VITGGFELNEGSFIKDIEILGKGALDLFEHKRKIVPWEWEKVGQNIIDICVIYGRSLISINPVDGATVIIIIILHIKV